MHIVIKSVLMCGLVDKGDTIMEFLKDWRFWLLIIAIINLVRGIGSSLFQKYSHDKITGNDLKHLTTEVKGVKDEQKCIKDKIFILSADVSKIKGKLDLK